jgi:hypothetical protein
VADDIVERLRYQAWLNPSEGVTADAHYLAADALAEIERLRQRGDNLHTVAVEMPNPRHNLSWLAWRTQMDNALMGWEEARRR